MKGYPKHIATKQDYLNLIADPEFRERAVADLKIIAEANDEKTTKTLSIDEATGAAVTEEIDNPMPLWRIKGFDSRQDVMDLIAEVENG